MLKIVKENFLKAIIYIHCFQSIVIAGELYFCVCVNMCQDWKNMPGPGLEEIIFAVDLNSVQYYNIYK